MSDEYYFSHYGMDMMRHKDGIKKAKRTGNTEKLIYHTSKLDMYRAMDHADWQRWNEQRWKNLCETSQQPQLKPSSTNASYSSYSSSDSSSSEWEEIILTVIFLGSNAIAFSAVTSGMIGLIIASFFGKDIDSNGEIDFTGFKIGALIGALVALVGIILWVINVSKTDKDPQLTKLRDLSKKEVH